MLPDPESRRVSIISKNSQCPHLYLSRLSACVSLRNLTTSNGSNLQKSIGRINGTRKLCVLTVNPIFFSFSMSTTSRPSNTKAGLFIPLYTTSQSISRNSFHSVAMTTASASLHASSADEQIVTCFLTIKNKYLIKDVRRNHILASRGVCGLASARSIQIWACGTLGS
jgi:hypothetical protein